MNKKFNELSKNGLDSNLAILLLWEFYTEEQRGRWTIRQCQSVWESLPDDSPEKNEVFQLVKNKVKTFEDYLWLGEKLSIVARKKVNFFN